MAIRVHMRARERGGVSKGRLDWVGLTDPVPVQMGLTSQVGWAWLMGQGPMAIESRIKLLILFSSIIQIQNKFKFFGLELYEVIPFSKITGLFN
jgi:hypothetical protein